MSEVSHASDGFADGVPYQSLLVEFFLGLRGVFGFRFRGYPVSLAFGGADRTCCLIAVWVEVTGAVGTARARLQLISNPPLCAYTQ